MVDYQKKRKIRKILYSRTVFFIVCILTIFFLHSAWSVYQKKAESVRNLEKAQKELVDLEQKQKELSDNITSLRTGTGVEEEIRSKFNVAKDGEKTVIIVEPSQASTTGTSTQSFLGNAWNAVKGWFGR